jgi:predicted TIM-barrel enzyme
VKIARDTLVANLRREREQGRPLLIASAGSGLVTRCAVEGGADAIAVYSSGRYRAAGLPSLAAMLPFASANDVVSELLREVVPAALDCPVLAGVCAADPFQPPDALLEGLMSRGVSGVQNFPTVGLIDGRFRGQLEESGLGFGLDVSLVDAARNAGLFTAPFVFDAESARQMAAVGPDALVVHAGATSGGSVGVHTALSVHECANLVETVHAAAAAELKDVLLLFHGGSISDAVRLRELLGLAPMLDGYVGASAVERTPIEWAVTEATRSLKQAAPS